MIEITRSTTQAPKLRGTIKPRSARRPRRDAHRNAHREVAVRLAAEGGRAYEPLCALCVLSGFYRCQRSINRQAHWQDNSDWTPKSVIDLRQRGPARKVTFATSAARDCNLQ